jgi:O-antigen/teichoic acid export membrane protein
MANLLRAFRGRGRHFLSFGWSAGQYVVQPIAMLIATPLLLAALGKEQFGLWVLVMAFVGLDTAAGLGMGAATIKYVSDYRGRGDLLGAARCARQTASISLIGGAIIGSVIALSAPWLASTAFARMGDPTLVARGIAAGGVLLLLQQLEGVYGAVLKGCERFDLAAMSDGIVRLVVLGVACLCAWITGDAVLGLVAWGGCSLIGLSLRIRIATLQLGHNISTPIWDPCTVREVFSFGGWNWLQGIATTMFQQADRFIIGAVLGAQSLAVYGICMQVASQIHSLPSAGLSFIFPVVSRKIAADPKVDIVRMIVPVAALNLTFSALLALPIFIFGDWLLQIWVGPQMQLAVGSLLFWMTLVYFLTSLGIAPYYLLLGRGDARFTSMANIIGGAGSACAAVVFIPLIGLWGGVFGRAVTIFIVIAAYSRLYWLAVRRPPLVT